MYSRCAVLAIDFYSAGFTVTLLDLDSIVDIMPRYELLDEWVYSCVIVPLSLTLTLEPDRYWTTSSRIVSLSGAYMPTDVDVPSNER